MSQQATSHVLGYTEFGAWYDAHRQAVLDPALEQALAALTELVSDQLSERDLTRIRMTTGRVKSKRRTWRKLHHARYQGRITTVGDIPEVIDDLVGLRITCVNVRDIEMVQSTLDGLPKRHGRKRRLWIDPASERDYVAEPKESGYRGWHVNLGIVVEVDGKPLPVTCELQVRTLLEDSWGELTHEDTYSKDGGLPPLVEVLSRRMADLLSTLDDIAEDLRTELDRIDDLTVADSTEIAASSEASATPSEQAADAAAILLDRWRTIDRPVDLAALAWGLQREFGAEISDDWFGQRTFKRFLRYAVPDGEISSGSRAYLIPARVEPDRDVQPEAPDSTVPAAARELRRVDRGFPLLEKSEWQLIYRELAEAWQLFGSKRTSMRVFNQISRAARDHAAESGAAISRRHLDYVAKAVFPTVKPGTRLDAKEIGRVFTAETIERMIQLRIISAKNPKPRRAVESWLNA